MKSVSLKTPLGYVVIFGDEAGICEIRLGGLPVESRRVPDVLQKAYDLLSLYFEGKKVDFSDVPLIVRGTPFQKRVWNALKNLPYGELKTYKWLADRIGCRSPRAVGRALAANRIPVVIPCHRIVKKDGSLGGFSAGVKWKRFLLELEGWEIEI